MDSKPPGMGRTFPPGMHPNSGMPPMMPSQHPSAAPMPRGAPLQFEFGRVVDASKLKERGFAFIAPEDGSENLFYHIHWCECPSKFCLLPGQGFPERILGMSGCDIKTDDGVFQRRKRRSIITEQRRSGL